MKITLVRSLNGRNKKHIATAHSLGLRRIGDTNENQKDSPATRGKLTQISYLIRVEE